LDEQHRRREGVLFLEVIVCGWVPGLILIIKPLREKSGLRVTAFALGIIGVSINRWVLVLQTMAAPVMSFDKWALYIPSWQEVATTLMPIAMGVIIVMLSYRYLPIFPQESELNPVSKFNH
jgi:Ni/Fe-hydrogenase subunit HybB-like protein